MGQRTGNRDFDIGRKLRLLRGNMTQAELARRSRIDKAIISKIESGKMQGTVESHKRLADVFGLKLSELYAFFEEEKPEPVQVRPGSSRTDFYQDFLQILTSIPLSKKMLPAFLTLNPSEEKCLEETVKKVERFIIVLDGSAEVEIAGKRYRLSKEAGAEKGDCLYSSSPRRHTVRCSGTSGARLLCVSCPPVL